MATPASDTSALEARYTLPNSEVAVGRPRTESEDGNAFDAEELEEFTYLQSTRPKADVKFLVLGWLIFLPQLIFWFQVQQDVQLGTASLPLVVTILTGLVWGGLTLLAVLQRVYCPFRKGKPTSRLERFVTTRVRRQSWLDEDFKRKGVFALDAIAAKDLEVQRKKEAMKIQRKKEKARRKREGAAYAAVDEEEPESDDSDAMFAKLMAMEAGETKQDKKPDSPKKKKRRRRRKKKPVKQKSCMQKCKELPWKKWRRALCCIAPKQNIATVESYKSNVNRRELALAALSYIFADVVPSTIVLMLMVYYLAVGVMAVFGILLAEDTSDANLYRVPVAAGTSIAVFSAFCAQAFFVYFSAPYTHRWHPGWHLTKMMLRGFVIGVGLVAGYTSLIGFVSGFMAAVFMDVFRWQSVTSSSVAVFAMFLLAMTYCCCPLLCWCYCCLGVTRVDKDQPWQSSSDDLDDSGKDWDPDDWASFCDLCAPGIRSKFLKWTHEFRIKRFPNNITLATALRWGHAELTLTLLRNGADPNGIEYGRMELDHAVMGGSTDCATMLLGAGAKLGLPEFNPLSPSTKHLREEGPLHIAVMNRDYRMMRCLFDAGESTNLRTRTLFRTPLHMSLTAGFDDITENLLYRPDIDLMARDGNDVSVLELATSMKAEKHPSKGPDLVIESLQHKVELERFANRGQLGKFAVAPGGVAVEEGLKASPGPTAGASAAGTGLAK